MFPVNSSTLICDVIKASHLLSVVKSLLIQVDLRASIKALKLIIFKSDN